MRGEREREAERAGKQKVYSRWWRNPVWRERQGGGSLRRGQFKKRRWKEEEESPSFSPINTRPCPGSSPHQRHNRSLPSVIAQKRKKKRRNQLRTPCFEPPACRLFFCLWLLRSPAACAMSSGVCESRLPSLGLILDGLGDGARCDNVSASAAEAAAIERWLALQEEAIQKEAEEKKDGQSDIWNSIQSSKKAVAVSDSPAPYVHPLVRRSASSLSQQSLEICTESLGSETGSDGVLSNDELGEYLPWPASGEEDVAEEMKEIEKQHHEAEDADRVLSPPLQQQKKRKELATVNYHCSISMKSPPRTFPPPLPSLSRRDGPCLSMRTHRRDGRLVMEAVSVPSQNYLHARRHDGRLLLTLVETTFQEVYPQREEPAMQHLLQQLQADIDGPAEDGTNMRWPEDLDDSSDDAYIDEREVEEEDDRDEEEEEGEEEVEVVDRGIVVEVKVSRPPQSQNGGMKVQRSSVVINKFVGAAMEGELAAASAVPKHPTPRNATATTTTTATAVVAAAAAASSSLSTDECYWRYGTGPQSAPRHPSPEKLFFTSKRQMNRQDLLHQVRRCSEHLRPLFIWEPCCIATS